MRRFSISMLVLAALMVAFRLLGAAYSETLPNLQPLPALLLCSFIFLDGKARWALPLGVWAVTDPLASLWQGGPVFGWQHLALLLGLGTTVALAALLRRRPSAAMVLGGSVVAAVMFYFLTNTVSFLTLPLYSKTVAGFVQAQWTGPVGLGPTWLFLRNSLVANLAFGAMFLVALRPWRVALAVPARAA